MSQEPYHKPLLGEIHPVRKLHLGKACHHSNQLIDKTKSIPSLKVQIRWLHITLQTAYHSWLQKRAKMYVVIVFQILHKDKPCPSMQSAKVLRLEGRWAKWRGGGGQEGFCWVIHIFSVHFENTISKSYIKVSIDIKHCWIVLKC